jgi:cytochrome P450
LNPDIQKKLRDEIKLGIEENNGKLTYDMLFGFKYLDMVVNESLRKYPPAFIMRRCTKDFHIPNTNLIVPKDTQININVFSFHRDSNYFSDPEKFDPERFSSENVDKIVPFTYLPFGMGPRKCIGGRFGLMQSKMSIAKLISNYEISTNSKTINPMEFSPPSLFLTVKNGLYLTMKKIQK